MNDVIVEKLIQKVINLTDEVNDVNIQVRRLSPPQEIINKIHERLDAIHTAIGLIEQRLESDDGRILALQRENIVLKEEADKREKSLEQRLKEKADLMEKNLELRSDMLAASLSRLSEELLLTRKETKASIHSLKEALLLRIASHNLGLWVAGVLVVVVVGVLIFKR
jgi:hypothetical protein